LSETTVPPDNLSFKAISNQISDYLSNQFNKILLISKVSSLLGAKATFKASNNFLIHNLVKREDPFSEALSQLRNKLHHMIEYNKLILNYLNNKTQTHQIEKQLCMIEAIEEILFSFDSLSPNNTLHTVFKRDTNQTHSKERVAKSTLLHLFKSTFESSKPSNFIAHLFNLIPQRTKRQIHNTTFMFKNVTQSYTTMFKIPFQSKLKPEVKYVNNYNLSNGLLNTNISRIFHPFMPKTHTIFNVTLNQGDDTTSVKPSIAYENALIILALTSLAILIVIQCIRKKAQKKICIQPPKLFLHV
jgi:hypothetical protein